MQSVINLFSISRAKNRFLSLPWWVQTLLVYTVARVFTLCVMIGAARFQVANPWTAAGPNYLNYIQLWDSAWYKNIFDNSYPTVLPKDAIGTVAQNNWAFYPLFPYLVRGLHVVTGFNWLYLSPIVATIAGYAAILFIYKIFSMRTEHRNALWAVAFFSFFPVSPILQVPYAESTNMLLLSASLFFLMKRNYLIMLPFVFLMCLSRPTGVPFCALIFFHTIYRWVTEKGEDFPVKDKIVTAVVTCLSGLFALMWPAIAGLVTGNHSAYTDTEMAWRGGNLTFFVPWFNMGAAVLGSVGYFAPMVIFPVLFAVLYSKKFRIIGFELQCWCTCYAVYLFAVLMPQTSTFRMLIPLFPMALGAVNFSKDKAYRYSVILMFALLQIVWVCWLWDFTPLPQGGDWPP